VRSLVFGLFWVFGCATFSSKGVFAFFFFSCFFVVLSFLAIAIAFYSVSTRTAHHLNSFLVASLSNGSVAGSCERFVEERVFTRLRSGHLFFSCSLTLLFLLLKKKNRKNTVLQLTEIEKKVKEATSNEKRSPHSTTMREIAQATFS
jgi:quinol-cytochrome oxidoreductase complex cytochrome b subunit